MDRTEIYIKMSDCEEIQGLKVGNWEHGDFLCVNHQVFNYPVGYRHDAIWLPRQDQLQEMLQPCGFGILLWDFHSFASTLIRDENITSMEQLWLAFVMKERFNKVWDGKEWINRNQ